MQLKANGIRHGYDLAGPKDAPPLVLIHGFPFNRTLWEPQRQALAAYRVLRYDLRGFGRSELGAPPQPLEAYVDDLFALLDALELGAPVLGGLSMGGYIALRAVQREPKRFPALMLFSTRADADGDEAKLGRAAGIQAVRAKGTRAFARALLPKLLSPATRELRPALAAALLAMMQAQRADAVANALSAMAGRTDTHAGLAAYPGPVLVVAGSADVLVPPALSEALAQVPQRGRLVRIAGAGHAGNWEAQDAFNQALLAFMAEWT